MEDRRKAHSMMRECEKEIDLNPGFENFQQSPPLGELQRSAVDGPIVVVNVSTISSDAIILTTFHLETIPLPGMAMDVPEIFQWVLGRYLLRPCPPSSPPPETRFDRQYCRGPARRWGNPGRYNPERVWILASVLVRMFDGPSSPSILEKSVNLRWQTLCVRRC